MLKNYKNKSISEEDIEVKEVESVEEEYHFSGGTEYEPLTVKAKNIKEATEKYEDLKVKIIKN